MEIISTKRDGCYLATVRALTDNRPAVFNTVETMISNTSDVQRYLVQTRPADSYKVVTPVAGAPLEWAVHCSAACSRIACASYYPDAAVQGA
jgi:hypothetical protein